MNIDKVAKQISILRKSKGLTQNDLGERIGVSFQAVSKWERGEALPDVAVLPDLAKVLETSIDNILLGGEKQIEYKGKIKVCDMINGLNCLKSMGEYMGKDNIIYQSALKGVNKNLNTDIEKAFIDDYVFEAFLSEVIIQNLILGMYIDLSDIKNNFKYEHFKNIVIEYCSRYGIK